MKPLNYCIGVDVSKAHLDLAVWLDGKIVAQFAPANGVSALRKCVLEMRRLDGFAMSQAVFCVEHTGIYCAHLLEVLQQAKGRVALVAAVEVQRSLGLQRGKNDQVDARRLAEYAARFSDKLRFWQAPRPVLRQLKQLATLRQRLLNAKIQLQVPLDEGRPFTDKVDQKILEQHSQGPLKALQKALEEIEEQIRSLIQQDEDLRGLFEQITSVPGVGAVTACEIITTTNEFKDFDDPRKFACHAGVAPFEHQSGSSVRGKPRVSHKANKTLKTLLHLAAMSAIRSKSDLQVYYLRKTAEGKAKLSVINAVRNKIIHRIFALVKNHTTYQKNYQLLLAKP